MNRYCYLFSFFIIISFGLFRANAENWKSIGPWGGRHNHLVADPLDWKVLYANEETFHNGYYRTLDAGISWKRLRFADFLRISPLKPDLVYLTFSNDLFISRDKGNTFQQFSHFPGGEDLQFHTQNASILYSVDAFSGNLKTFISNDAGLNWSQKTFQGSFFGAVQLLVDPSDGNILYVILEESSGNAVWKSTNGGDSWTRINKGLACCSPETQTLAIDPKHPNTLYAGGPQGIFKSTNGGNRWNSTNCRCSVQSIAINAANPDQIYTVGSSWYADKNRIPFAVRSNDGGKTWLPLGTPIAEAWSYQEILSHPMFPNVLYVSALEKGFFRSTDNGKTWKELPNRGLNSLVAQTIEPDTSLPGHIMTISSQILMQTYDFGKNWNLVNGIGSAKTFDVKIHPRNSNLQIVQMESQAAITTNGGLNWTYRKTQFKYPTFYFHPNDQNFLVRLTGDLFISTNLGRTWKRSLTVPSRDITAVAIYPKAKNILYAVSHSGSLYRSSNKAKSWQLMSTLPYYHEINWIVVHPEKPNVILIGAYFSTETGNGSRVYKSSDSGRNWNQVLDGANALVFNPLNSNQVFAIFGSLKVSNDEGETWSAFATQPPDILFGPLNITAWNRNSIFVASFPTMQYRLH